MNSINILLLLTFAAIGAMAQAPPPPVFSPAGIFDSSVVLISEELTTTFHLLAKLDLTQQKEYVKITLPAFPTTTYFEMFVDFAAGDLTIVQSDQGNPTCFNITGVPMPTITTTFVGDHCTYAGPALINNEPCQQWACPFSFASVSLPGAIFSRGNRLIAETISVPASETGPAFSEFINIDDFIPLPSLPRSVFQVPSFCSSGAATRRSEMPNRMPTIAELIGALQAK